MTSVLTVRDVGMRYPGGVDAITADADGSNSNRGRL
jgi:hypothetical protein